MKATKIISACAVLVALASCSNDHVISQPGAEDTPIRIQANVGAVTTKAGHNLLESSFGSGDAINVYISENTSNNSGTSSGGSYSGGIVYTHNGTGFTTANTQFFPANGNGIDIWGVYPSTVNESTQDFTIEDNQTSDDNYKKSDLMFASQLVNKTKTDDINLTFNHQLSKIIVKLDKEQGVDA
ncbi:MAG: fimbrillin family protein, partial [Prevotella sp.]